MGRALTKESTPQTNKNTKSSGDKFKAHSLTSPAYGIKLADNPVPLQAKFGNSFSSKTLQRKSGSGLPDDLKTNMEQMGGVSLADVKVNYNSSKPKQIGALAYTRGNQIDIGPGQERHLPHEAWHAVQQKQGRVQPTTTVQAKGLPLNDNAGLEREADVMGAKAVQKKANNNTTQSKASTQATTDVVQQMIEVEDTPSMMNVPTATEKISSDVPDEAKGITTRITRGNDYFRQDGSYIGTDRQLTNNIMIVSPAHVNLIKFGKKGRIVSAKGTALHEFTFKEPGNKNMLSKIATYYHKIIGKAAKVGVGWTTGNSSAHMVKGEARIEITISKKGKLKDKRMLDKFVFMNTLAHEDFHVKHGTEKGKIDHLRAYYTQMLHPTWKYVNKDFKEAKIKFVTETIKGIKDKKIREQQQRNIERVLKYKFDWTK